MILHLSYEELSALKAGAGACLKGEGVGEASVLAPPEERARIEALLPRLVGDCSISTLHEARGVQIAVQAIVECLRVEMEAVVLATHAADEVAVAAYFDFAHALVVADRISEIVAEMSAMIELVTGHVPTVDTARDFRFPD